MWTGLAKLQDVRETRIVRSDKGALYDGQGKSFSFIIFLPAYGLGLDAVTALLKYASSYVFFSFKFNTINPFIINQIWKTICLIQTRCKKYDLII